MDDFGDNNVARARAARADFYLRPKQNKRASLEAGRPIFEQIEYVRIHTGSTRNIVDARVSDIHRKRYPREYAAFQAGRNQAEASGTLLSAWGAISPERVAELESLKILTVEQLAGLPDSQLARAGLHTRRERERANAYLEHAAGAAPVMKLSADLEQKDKRIVDLERQLKQVLEDMAADRAEKKAADTEPVKRGPGRPRKADAPADTEAS